MDLEHERRLTQVEQRSKSNTHRLEKLEESTEAINRLATSMEVMVSKQEQVAQTVDKLDKKVTAIEEKPVKRVNSLVDKIIWAICAAVITFVLKHVLALQKADILRAVTWMINCQQQSFLVMQNI